MNDLASVEPTEPVRDLPDVDLEAAFEAVVGSPNTASKAWVYRQYDHEVGTRTARKPGDDAAVMAIREVSAPRRGAEGSNGDSRETGVGLGFAAGADPNWTDVAPREGARAIALENATNLAAKGLTPLAAVDCLNGGNPEKPAVYGGFEGIVDGLAEMCRELEVPVVGGNVSLYNDSPSGPIPPTPTLAMVGTKPGFDVPSAALAGDGELLVVGGRDDLALGGSELLAQFGGSDRFPEVPEDAGEFVEAIVDVAGYEATRSTHDVSHGGLAVALAEMVGPDAGADVTLDGAADGGPAAMLFSEAVGRVVVETTDPEAVRERFDGVAPVERVGEATDTGRLELAVDGTTLRYSASDVTELRDVISAELG